MIQMGIVQDGQNPYRL